MAAKKFIATGVVTGNTITLDHHPLLPDRARIGVVVLPEASAEEKERLYFQLLAEAGITVTLPQGGPVEDFEPVPFTGAPPSEIIIKERR